jgi:hypothetical protein
LRIKPFRGFKLRKLEFNYAFDSMKPFASVNPSIIFATECGDHSAVGQLKFQHAEDAGTALGAIPDQRNWIAGLEHFLSPPAPVQSAGIGEFPVPFDNLPAVVGHIDKKLAMGIDKIKLHHRSFETRGLRCIECRCSMVCEHWTRK